MSAKFRKTAVWILSFIIIACIACAIPSLALNGGVSYALSGDGTQEIPFTISSVNELKAFRDDVNNGNSYSGKYVVLTTDLDLQNKSFEPIGNNRNKPFSGIFDGNGHTIKNLYIKKIMSDSALNNIAFFGTVSNGTVKNFTLDGEYVYSASSNGAAATTSKKSGEAIATLSAGAVGAAFNSTVSNVHCVGQVNAIGGNGGAGSTKANYAAGGKGGDGYAGGVVAQSKSSQIIDCSFVGLVYAWGGTGGQGGAATDGAAGAGGSGGKSFTGGIVAYAGADTDGAPTQISRCYSNYYMLARAGSGGAGGNAASNTSYAGGAGGAGDTVKSGGIVGRLMNAAVENCFAVGQVDLYSAVNGIPGNYGSNSKNNVQLRTTRSLQSIGGIVGSAEVSGSTITNVYAQTNIEEAYISHGISDVNTHMGGIVGTITAEGVKIENAVTLPSSMTAEKGIYDINGQEIKAAKGATMSPVATFETNEVATSVNSLAENIAYVQPEYQNQYTTSPKPTFNLVSAEVTRLDNVNWSDEGWWKDDAVWEINPAYNGGNPVLKGVPFKVYPKRTFEIDDYEKLYSIASRIDTGEVFLDLTLNINADIDLGGSDWIMLGTDFYNTPFKLTINGNNHKITGMRISKTSSCKGFVGYGRAVIINDLTIEDPQITGAGGDYTGGLVGYAQYYAKLNNCHVTMGNKPSSLNSKIVGRTYTGGLVGCVNGNEHRSEIVNCSSVVNVRCATGAGTSTSLYVGGLLGVAYWARIENSYATGNVSCDSYSTQTYFAGGLVGALMSTSQVVNCFATGNVTVGSEGSFIGYIHQQARGTQVFNCYYTGNVTYTFNNINSSTFIRYGGLVARCVGLNVGFYNNVVLTQKVTFASNTAKASYRRLGSLVSAAAPSKSLAATPANSTNTVTPTEWANCYQASTRITPVYQNNHMIKTDWKANNVAIAHNNGTTNNYFINQQATTVTQHNTMSEMQTQSFWENTMHYDFTKDWEFNPHTLTPTLKDNPYTLPGLDDNAIEISTKEELGIFRDVVNAGTSFAGRKIRLTADIDMSGVNWKPIGAYSATASANRYFQGSFDGDGHTIKNLYVNQTAEYKGLFGYAASGSEIKNINFTNPVIERNGYKYTGVVAAYLVDGTIENCHVVGGRFSSTENFVAGIVGIVDGKSVGATNIKNCSVTYAADTADNYTNQISGASYVGAIAGITRGTVEGGVTISDCYSNFNVTSTNIYLGGIVGYACGTNILRCYSTGSVSAETTGFAGGIVGSVGNAYIGTPLYSAVSNITDCFTTGDVRSYAEADAVSIAGGIAGRINGAGAVISNCIVYGDIGTNNLSTSSDKKVSSAGGIVGLAEVANVK
ncbi:MAG: hypothetical protein K2N47_02335, partial [Clostridia bacterium]|nr:hypothetical protein [Clostridia bacterium]